MNRSLIVKIIAFVIVIFATATACAFIAKSHIESYSKRYHRSLDIEKIVRDSNPTPHRANFKAERGVLSSSIIYVWKEENGEIGWCTVSPKQKELVELGIIKANDIKLAYKNMQRKEMQIALEESNKQLKMTTPIVYQKERY